MPDPLPADAIDISRRLAPVLQDLDLSKESFPTALRRLQPDSQTDTETPSAEPKARLDIPDRREARDESHKLLSKALKKTDRKAAAEGADLAAAIRALPEEARLEMIAAQLKDKAQTRDGSYLLIKLPVMLESASLSGKFGLLMEVAESMKGQRLERTLSAIFKSSRDIEELALLTRLVGLDDPGFAGTRDLKELIALASLGPEMRHAKIPKPVSSRAPRDTVNRKLDEIKTCLLERIATCAGHIELEDTRTHKEFMLAALYNLDYLKEERKGKKSTPELRELANMLIAKIGVESRFCVALTCETDDEGVITSRWTAKDVKDVQTALTEIPENRVLFTPQLFRIERVEGNGGATLGSRDYTGTIELADATIDNKPLVERYRGISSLTSTLTHELGHALQIGSIISAVGKLHMDGHTFRGPADPAYDFERYMEISGWTTFARKEYRLKDGGQSVVLRGKEYLMDVPTVIDGRGMMLVYDESDKRLYGYPLDAKFSVGTYCRTSPWEDWAEAFTDYILLPKRLINFAPEKFSYFEEQIGKYTENRRIQSHLRKKLEQAD